MFLRCVFPRGKIMKNNLLFLKFSCFMLFCVFLFAGCGVMPVAKQREFLMGTAVDITVHNRDSGAAGKAVKEAFAEAERLEAMFSVYREDSEVSRINSNAGKEAVRVSEETFYLIDRAVEFSRISGGAFDITVMPMVELWKPADGGYVPSEEEIAEVMPLVGYGSILLDRENSSVKLLRKGMKIDLGAVAKGFVVDRMADVFKRAGMSGALVNAGGDIYALGTSYSGGGWRVGLRHPREKEKIVDVFTLEDRAAATSGDYERYFMRDGERYSHIIDPGSGRPARGVISVTVLAESCMEADALATMLFVMGLEEGKRVIEEFNAEAVIFKEGWEYGEEKRI